MLKDYFMRCEEWFPERRTELRQVSLALRRERIETMEQLRCLMGRGSEGVLAIRAIGAKRLELIEQVCRLYERDCAAAPRI